MLAGGQQRRRMPPLQGLEAYMAAGEQDRLGIESRIHPAIMTATGRGPSLKRNGTVTALRLFCGR